MNKPRLIVLGPAERHPVSKQGRTLVRCMCGTERIVHTHNLVALQTTFGRRCRCHAPVPWTPAEDAALRKLGSTDDITDAYAAALGRSREQTRKRALSLGVARSKYGAKSWLVENDGPLLRLRADGKSWTAIAAAIPGTSKTSVQRRHAELLAEASAATSGLSRKEAALAVGPKEAGHPISWGAITLHDPPYDAGELCA